ncbi:MAG TPA: hypothetical protein VF409_13290 [Sphingomonas sp.]
MSDAVTFAPVAQSVRSVFPKVPRDRIVTLAVETDPCPQALLRVLGTIAQQGLVAMTIAAERFEEGQRVAVAIDALPEERLELLVARIESIVAVRDARVVPGGMGMSLWGQPTSRTVE